MTTTPIAELSDLEFTDILKQCLIRLQYQNMTVVRVELDGFDESSIILPYVDCDENEPIRYNVTNHNGLGTLHVAEGTEITHHIK